jgi:hypothetical protein
VRSGGSRRPDSLFCPEGEYKNDNDTCRDLAFDRVGRVADVAVQPELGLLSQRRTRFGGGDFVGADFIGADVRRTRGERLAAGRFSLAIRNESVAVFFVSSKPRCIPLSC